MKTREECFVPGCGKLMEPLCCLPRDEVQQREWLRVIGNVDSKTKSVENIYYNYRICRKHFTDEAFHKLSYRNKSHGFVVKINAIPTLHLPEIKEDYLPHTINMNSIESTLSQQAEPPLKRKYLQPAHVPMTTENNDNIQNKKTNSVKIEPSKQYADCKKKQIEPEHNVQKTFIKGEPLQSCIQTTTETFASSSNIEEKSVGLKTKHIPEESERKGNTADETKRQTLCCVVPGCGQLMKPLCRLPHDETQQRDWLRVIGNANLKTKNFKTIYSYYRICRKHFTDEAFHNLSYRKNRLINLHRYLNNIPTLHLPEIKDVEVSDMINLNNSETLALKLKHLVQDEAKQQSEPMIDIPETSTNKNNKSSRSEAEPRTYCREVKNVPEIHVKKEPLEIYTKIEISEPNEVETFISASNIKEENIDIETDKIDEKHVCVQSDTFGEHVAIKLQSFDQNTRNVVKKLIDNILLNA